MTQERNRLRADLQVLIEAETDPTRWIAMKDFVEALDDVDSLERAESEPMRRESPGIKFGENPEQLLAADDDSTADHLSDNPIDLIFEPPTLTTEQLRNLAIRVGAHDAVDAVDRGDLGAAKSILARLGHYGASIPLPPDL